MIFPRLQLFTPRIRRHNGPVSHQGTRVSSSPSIFRLLSSILYDSIALAAIWFFAGLIVVIALQGKAVNPGNLLFLLYLIAVAYAYFGWCWTRGGQTLGMKAWKIRLATTESDQTIGWKCAAIRFAAAILSFSALGLGYFWSVIDRDSRTWHDRISRSHILNI